MSADQHAEFEAFFAVAEPRLRRALVAAYGTDRGREAAAEALAYAFEHWQSLRSLENPIGYLNRVGQSRSRPRRTRVLFVPSSWHEPIVEPGLAAALRELSERQRLAVVLVHGFGWHLHEVAEITGIKTTTVQNHLERGLARLRSILEVHDHA